MRKAIGLLTCTLMAGTTLWFVSGQQSTGTISAQIEDSGSVSDGGYDSAARRFLDEARALANKGDVAGAKRLAQTAARFPVKWNPNEVTPEEFLRSLGPTANQLPASSVGQANLGGSVLPTNRGWQSEDGFVEPRTTPATTAQNDATRFRSSETNDTFFQPSSEPVARPATNTPVAKKPAPVLSARKRQAMVLIRQARTALNGGKYDIARARALQAKQMGATYGLFDDRPEHILGEIERQTQTETFAGATQTKPTAVEQKQNDPRYTVAVALLREARHAMTTGDLQTAKRKAEQASQLGADFPAFEDRPELVLSDIAAAGQRPAPATSVDPRTEALALLKQARQSLAANSFDAASAAANAAAKLNVTYDLSDDRPELVLQEIGRLSAPTPVDAEGRLAKAQELLVQSRQEIAAGNTDLARGLAQQAEQLDAVYGIYDDRHDLVMTAIDEATGQQPANEPIAATQVGELPVIQANRLSAMELYNKGLASLRTGDESIAREAFTQAYQSGEKLDAFRQQQLEDFLRELGPVKPKSNIQLTAAQFDEFEDIPSFDIDSSKTAAQGDTPIFEEPPISSEDETAVAMPDTEVNIFDNVADAADVIAEPAVTNEVEVVDQAEADFNQVPGDVSQQSMAGNAAVKYDRFRTETLNAVFRAEKLREKNPDQALEILDRATSNVESAELDMDSANTLLGYLSRTGESIKSYIDQREPIIAMERQNRETKKEIEKEIAAKVRIEQEFADLVENYNKLMDERRYAEAQITAKQAKELSPENPVAVTMVWKAQFAREHARNMDVKDRKAQGFLDVLHDVDIASIPFSGEIEYPKDWDELTKRRRKYGQADNRTRTEQDLRIEESLNKQVSLHFENEELTEVIKHISTVANVNVVLDSRGLEEEGVQTDELVSIDVDGIRLKSALNLLLEPYGLAYTIKDEVLKITSRMRQDGEMERRTYSVADLVIPVPNFGGHNSGLFGDLNRRSAPMTPGGNFNVPSGGLQVNGGAMFQVNDMGDNVGTNPWLGAGGTGNLAGGGSSVDFNSLTDLIISTIEPSTWDEVGGDGAVVPVESTLSLVIRQTQRVHEEIRDLLEQLRRLQDLQVTVEVRFISVTDRFFERIGVDFDFNVQDNLGDPPGVPAFGSRQLTFLDGAGGGGGGGAAGGAAGGDLRGGAQAGQVAGGLFDPITRVRPPLDNWASGGSAPVVGLAAPGQFTSDFDIGFNQGSFNIGVPDFGNFQPDAGISVGLAILSDIEAFFFIQAAQADERANILFAPKVTLFNGQFASITDIVQRPFVVSVTPVVGNFSVGFQPIIQTIPDGISLFVQAVISADRRFVRLTLSPQFNNLVDVFTFTTIGGAGGVGGQQGGQAGGQGGGGLGGGGGGGFGGGGQGGGGGGFGGGGIGGGFGGIGGMSGLVQNRLMESSISQGIGGQGGGQGGGIGGGQGGQGGGLGGGQAGQGGGQGGQGSVTLQQPVVETISVSTTVSVPDGGTVLLGGIKRLREGRNMAGVPILNKIPYVSRLFKNTGVGRETESVMMMVTPRIIIQEEEEELVLGTSLN